MSFESFAITVGTSDTLIYQMPAYTKTEDGEYAILPKSGALRLGFYNTAGSSQEIEIKVKTIFDLEPVKVGKVELAAGELKQWPVPLSLGPGDFIVAAASSANDIVVSGSVAASPIAPQTAAGETIWTNFVMRRPIDPTIAWAIASRTYGAAAAGGYFMGVIDTITGTINASDEYQTGNRYALLASPKALEYGRGTGTGDRQWDTRGSSSPVVAGTKTRWEGLASSNELVATGDTERQVFTELATVRTNSPAPATEGGSTWYVPALDELELFYRNGKPNAVNNRTDTQDGTSTFPAPLTTHGVNPSSLPTGAAYSNNPRNPDESPLALFKEGGAQAFSQASYWTSTEADADGAGAGLSRRAWRQVFTAAGSEGRQFALSKDATDLSVRPARRIVF